MLTLEQCRKIEPKLNGLPDEEVLDIVKDMYGLGQLAFEKWVKEKGVSKNPEWVLPNSQ